MKSFIKWIQIKESSGLNQVAGVGNDDENFAIRLLFGFGDGGKEAIS